MEMSNLRQLRKAVRGSYEPVFRRMHDSLFPDFAGRFQTLWDFAPDRRVNANDWLSEHLRDGVPFCAGRFGADEFELSQSWRRETLRSPGGRFFEHLAVGDPFYTLLRAGSRLRKRGLRPLTTDVRRKFHDLMVRSMEEVDLLGSWIKGEAWFENYLPDAKFAHLTDLEPYRFRNPWSEHLRDRRVLIIHPFEASIRLQYENRRERIFKDVPVLPEFELDTLVPPRAHFGEIKNAHHWFESLENLVSEVCNRRFDVAIIGAGPFGLPLAAAIKRDGRQAIHLGGATQNLFGILGGRWANDPVLVGFRSPAWVRPSPEETPSGRAQKMSQFSYW